MDELKEGLEEYKMSRDRAERIYFEYINDLGCWSESDFYEACFVLQGEPL